MLCDYCNLREANTAGGREYPMDHLSPGRCFECYHWMSIRMHDALQPDQVVIMDGHHYMMGPDTGPTRMRGFGGAIWRLLFTDGRRVLTRDLWHQGEIDPPFREGMPDNARSLTRGEWYAIGEADPCVDCARPVKVITQFRCGRCRLKHTLDQQRNRESYARLMAVNRHWRTL